MAKRITGSTPKLDGYRMPAEFEPQAGVWMLWPERNDNWRDGAKPAQKAFLDVATAILQFEPVTVCVSPAQYQNARERLPRAVRVVEMASNDAWIRDCGPTFLVNDNGGVRAVDWTFNAWGGLVDGLYFPWDLDDQVAQKVCEIERVDSYRTDGFVLEGGSIHVDGEGTVLTTEMCLLSEGRNPDKSKEEIEQMICDYLGCEKVLWIKDGIDPDETNGHIDDVALGYKHPEGYFYDSAALGKSVGRVANRIAYGRMTVEGKEYRLEVNNGVNHLHGGTKNFANRVWESRVETNRVVMALTSEDGDQGYPGTLTVKALYTWMPSCGLCLDIVATTDRPTVLNLTNHCYFNLDGHNSGSVLSHKLQLNASRYLVTDSSLAPTGE